MLDLSGIRKWLHENQSDSMILMSEYVEKENGKETSMVEARLILLLGEMDYTTASHVEKSLYQADESSAMEKMLTRISWETERDTKHPIDPQAALERGKTYQAR